VRSQLRFYVELQRELRFENKPGKIGGRCAQLAAILTVVATWLSMLWFGRIA
jgi:hypothetical protein